MLDQPQADQHCGKALALDARRVDARINYATALLSLGRAAEAFQEFERVLAVRPNSAPALVNRGLACMMLGRPSDAMALALRANAPIFVEDAVLEKSSSGADHESEETERLRRWLEQVDPEELGKYEM